MTPAQAQVLAPSPSMPTGLRALSPPFLMPDAGPLITLAYAGRLDLLLRPSWPLQLVDMVLHELARNATPTRVAIQAFVAEHQPTLVTTATFLQFQALQRSALNAHPMHRTALCPAKPGWANWHCKRPSTRWHWPSRHNRWFCCSKTTRSLALRFIYPQVRNTFRRGRSCCFYKKRAGLIPPSRLSDRPSLPGASSRSCGFLERCGQG